MSEKSAIYVRQSINHPEGIERALARTRELVTQRGWTLEPEHVFIDNDVSAKGGVRSSTTAWSRLLKAIESGAVTVVVSVDLDRLIRSISDLGILVKLGAKVTLVDGDLDLTTADGRLRASVLTAAAAFEVERKSERQTRANAYRVSQGKPVPGRRRYGYEPDNITPREPEAQDVRDLFAAFLSEDADAGEHKDRKSGSIRGLALARGWRPVRVRDTLTNPSYKGWVSHKGQASPGVITPLVSVEDWEAAQVKLADPTRKKTTGPSVRHLMSGLATCGVCGETMFYMRSYRCRMDAAHPSINKNKLEPVVMWEVFHWATEADEPEASKEVRALVTEAVETTRQRDAQQELYVMPGADKRKVAKELARLGAELERLEREIAVARSSEATADVLARVRGEWWDRREFKEFTENEQKALDEWPAYWESLSLDTQRSLVRALFRVTVNPGRIAEERVSFTQL